VAGLRVGGLSDGDCDPWIGANGAAFASVSFALVGTVADCVTVLGRLPVRTVASALRDQLQIAIESMEAGRPQRRGDLALQRGFGMIVGAACRLRDRQRHGRTAGLVCRSIRYKRKARNREK
jgi:hypothetical protein